MIERCLWLDSRQHSHFWKNYFVICVSQLLIWTDNNSANVSNFIYRYSKPFEIRLRSMQKVGDLKHMLPHIYWQQHFAHMFEWYRTTCRIHLKYDSTFLCMLDYVWRIVNSSCWYIDGQFVIITFSNMYFGWNCFACTLIVFFGVCKSEQKK